VTGLAAVLLLVATSLSAQEFETAGGAPFELSSALARGPLVMVFWSSWLPDAAGAVPVIHEVERSVREHGWSGAVIVFQDDSDTAASPLGAQGEGLPRVLDRRGVLLRRFQVTRAPALLVVDRAGQVISRTTLEPSQVRSTLASLAARSAPAR